MKDSKYRKLLKEESLTAEEFISLAKEKQERKSHKAAGYQYFLYNKFKSQKLAEEIKKKITI
jgi:hypothetical protein